MTESYPAYRKSVNEVLKNYHVEADKGLSDREADRIRKDCGYNELEVDPPTPLWQLVLDQFDDLLVKILLAAALLSFGIAAQEGMTKVHVEGEEGESLVQLFVEPVVILLILIINAIVGVWQESNAENALEELKRLQPKVAKTLRNGKIVELEARLLVPGDIVDLVVGDKIPADLRIIKLHTVTIRADEAALTGESETVLKTTDALGSDISAKDAFKQVNMLFSGTTICGGKCRSIVISIGTHTQVGSIAKAVSEEEDDKTPLKIKLDEFGTMLTKVIAGICLLVWVMNYQHFNDPIHGGSWIKGCIYYLKIAVALGVAAIPEGLPAVITLCLALGTRRMVEKNAIIRKLPSVETLGCVTVICSDKTGTLTLNQMTVTTFCYFGDSMKELIESKVGGDAGYNPHGTIENCGQVSEQKDKGIIDCIRVSTLCNDAEILWDDDSRSYDRRGEPTEAALKCFAEKFNVTEVPDGKTCHDVSDHYKKQCPRLATLEFSRGRKSMSVLCLDGEENVLFVKGAPEQVIERCRHVKLRDGRQQIMSEPAREALLKKVDELARRPLRTLVLAMRNQLQHGLATYNGESSDPAHQLLLIEPDMYANDIENYLVFLGLVGIKDPARPEVRPAIAKAQTAGIRVVMITGDKKETAESIAVEIGIFGSSEGVSGKSLEGAEYQKLSHAEKKKFLDSDRLGRVFSRTHPTDKSHIVKLFKELGEIPAMTGDGVNDAPALAAASIGIAMGISGTEVAKEASDMVLVDDNFATIVAAVEEGRAIYSNMKAFIRYLISSNIGEVASIFLTAALGFPEGLIPVQLLWVNLVTDGPPATALGFNPADADIMEQPPRDKDDELISGWIFFRYMVIGLYVGFATVGIFAYWYIWYSEAEDGHTLVTWEQLRHYGQCPEGDMWKDFAPKPLNGVSFEKDKCDYFKKDGKIVASTLSLTVLVAIEMFNALNALSEDGSLVTMPPWVNPWLLAAMAVSFGLHFVILYVPFLADIFNIKPLTFQDWKLVMYFSFPVILIDEILKFYGRLMKKASQEKRLRDKKSR